MLRADRAALFFRGKWSSDCVMSRSVVESWLRECRPPVEVFMVDPDDQPYACRWLVEQGRDDPFHSYQRRGAVVWLCRGKVVAEARNPFADGQGELRFQVEKAFARRP